MKKYKYELHLHTSEVSLCARNSAVEMVQYYKKMGFDGICVTDHYFNGNSVVRGNATRLQLVDGLCSGYEKALEEGRQIGLSVFFGWEYSFHGTDFLIYGLDRDWLLRNAAADQLSVNDYLDFVRSQGAIVCHAHPYREASYIEMIRLLPRHIDAVEVLNANRNDDENTRALWYAKSYGLPPMAGSDIHSTSQNRIAAHVFDRPFQSSGELLRAILAGEGGILEMNQAQL